MYTCINNELSKGLSKFSKTAFGGKFRKDGRLLCAGSEDTSVRVFDVNNKHLLRQFKGHDRCVPSPILACIPYIFTVWPLLTTARALFHEAFYSSVVGCSL